MFGRKKMRGIEKKKKREQFAALSVEQKEAHRRKNRDAHHKRKLTKLLSKPLGEQSQQISELSDSSGSVILATSNNCAAAFGSKKFQQCSKLLPQTKMLMSQLTEQGPLVTSEKVHANTLAQTVDACVNRATSSNPRLSACNHQCDNVIWLQMCSVSPAFHIHQIIFDIRTFHRLTMPPYVIM
nr:uncharacterized protein LOC113739415 [Coffea arabica]